MTKKPLTLEDFREGTMFYRLRRIMRKLPSDPRCKLCNAPFTGAGKMR